MAKMRDGVFELVVNIQGFEPEQVQIFSSNQTVLVKAKSLTHDGQVSNAFEQKFSLPDDVDTEKLTSGMSKDGILMIRVPRRAAPTKTILIKKEAKMDAVRKVLNMSKTTVEQLQADLQEAHIAPLAVEKPEDAVKAASAEVVEALTVGVAETCGGDAGELAGLNSGGNAAKTAVEGLVGGAVVEAVERVASEIAGEAGVKAALAVTLGEKTGAARAKEL